MNPKEVLEHARNVLVIDWPTKDAPESLARAGLHVIVHGGPAPSDYSAYELSDGKVVSRHVGRPPERADFIYAHRPLSELPQIIATARELGAKTIWTQSGFSAPGIKDPKGCWLSEQDLQLARDLVRSAGLNYLHQPYIGDVAREISSRPDSCDSLQA